MLYRDELEIETKKGPSFYDITDGIRKIVAESQIGQGVCNIYLQGTTAGIVINENERMLMEDFMRFFTRIADEGKMYSHSDNAFSHIRSAAIGVDKNIPVIDGGLALGQWQGIILWELDNKERKRKIIVSVIGEE